MLPEILQSVQDKGHVIFTSGSYNLNIVGVRTSSRVANKFDDRMHVIFKDEFGGWVDISFQITTDPGLYWLENSSRVEGTAILVPGQYRGVYQLGKHKGQYEALVQSGGKVKVYRDANKDNILDHEPSTASQGYFGINIHRASSSQESSYVNKWSAGCQVFSDPKDFEIFLSLCKKSLSMWGDSLTYTLIEE